MSYIHIISISGFFLFILACQSGKEKNLPTQTDTRPLVKAAYDSVDYMAIGAPFNSEQAIVRQQRFLQEKDPGRRLGLGMEYGVELLKTGQYEEGIRILRTGLDYITQYKVDMNAETKRNILAMIGIGYLRRGEIENCVQHHNHQSCFIPIAEGGIHQLPSGSQNAIKVYESILEEFPEDLETRYLLNIAYMTLGKYPDEVPAKYRIDPSWFKSKNSMQPFKDIAPDLNVNRKGHAGGVVLDDFTNDGWVDIVITSWSPKEELVFYVNNGDGSFTDKTSDFGLQGQVGILNLNQTDFNNDGWLDLYLMRGAWLMSDIPNTLLMNSGKGSFVDVTLSAGLTKHASTQAAAWSDFNLDGYLDLVVANESSPGYLRGIDLYINRKNGTFQHSSEKFGLNFNQFFKGCVATDVNNDRYPDIYFSSRNSGNFLYINQNGNSFKPIDPQKNPGKPEKSFPCFNFDYDNDGDEDLFVSGFTNEGTPAVHWMQSHMRTADPGMLPRLYTNKGNLEFEDAGVAMGLTEVAFTMGCNFGDINTDGFLDFYLATGNPQYHSIVPNKMYLNIEGKRFEDVSYSGGFANIQKGHGVGFGDLDHDGDEDIYVVIGGAYDGDLFYNCLFENPNESKNNWLVLKLAGQSANKAAIGARVAISVQENGKERKIFRTVTSGASFGANSLVLEVGLGKATSVNHVTVEWPCKECSSQVFTGIEINKSYSLVQDESIPALIQYDAVAFKAVNSQMGHDHH